MLLIRQGAPLSTSTPTVVSPQRESRSTVHGHILFFFGVILLLALGWKLSKELEILYVSALFAVVLFPIVRAIMRPKIRGYQASRPVAILVFFVAVVACLAVFFVVALPPVISDLRQFVVDLPGHVPQLVAKAKRLPLANKIGIDSVAQRAEGALSATATYLFASLPNWLSHLFDILTAIFLTVYFMLEGEYAYSFFLSMFHPVNRLRLDATLQKAEAKMSKWLLGQGLLMLILGVASTVAFGMLHVRYFVLLGVLMGLLNLIPIAGGVVTIILAAGVAALDSWTKMAGVLTFYAVYINIENAYLTPRIMRSSVDLMGLTVLVALLIGTSLAGVVGALVAVPTAALISVLLDEYAVQRV